MEKVIAIAIYNYKSLFRNIKSSAIMFVLPVIFIAVFGLAFGGSSLESFNIGLIKNDFESYSSFKEVLEEVKQNNNSEDSLFKITEFASKENAEEALKNGDISLFIIIPENFNPYYKDAIEIYGDQYDPSFNGISGVIREIAASYLGESTSYYKISAIDTGASTDLSYFDYLVPGLIVYALLILIPGIAQDFTRITEKQYIFRYFTSKTQSWQLLFGTGIYQFSLVFIQLILAYLTAYLFGFRTEANLLLAFVVAIPTGIFVVALGLLIGGLIKKMDTATNVGTMLSIVLGFFSGSFIVGIGQVLEFELFGTVIQFNDILPSKWASEALEIILINNGSLSDITNALLIILISGILLLFMAIIVYQKRQLSSSS